MSIETKSMYITPVGGELKPESSMSNHMNYLFATLTLFLAREAPVRCGRVGSREETADPNQGHHLFVRWLCN